MVRASCDASARAPPLESGLATPTVGCSHLNLFTQRASMTSRAPCRGRRLKHLTWPMSATP
eukprot:5230285-Lingulodinium_polyedra.AAC.1